MYALCLWSLRKYLPQTIKNKIQPFFQTSCFCQKINNNNKSIVNVSCLESSRELLDQKDRLFLSYWFLKSLSYYLELKLRALFFLFLFAVVFKEKHLLVEDKTSVIECLSSMYEAQGSVPKGKDSPVAQASPNSWVSCSSCPSFLSSQNSVTCLCL